MMAIQQTPSAGPIEGPRHNAALGNAAALCATITFAAGFPAAEILLETWDPAALVVARSALASGFVLIFWLSTTNRFASLAGNNWAYGLVVGALGIGCGSYLFLAAQSLSDPVSVAIIATLLPLCGLGFEIVLDGRRLTGTMATGMCLALAGGMVAIGFDFEQGIALGGWGEAMALVSVVLFAWASRATIVALPNLSVQGRTAVTLFGGFLGCLALFGASSAAGLASFPDLPLSDGDVAILMIYAIAAMALSHLLWIAGVARIGVALASIHINAAPFFVMLFMMALGADWRLEQFIGAVLVGAGAIIAQR